MNWKDACFKSKLSKAIRQNRWYTYIRNIDGSVLALNSKDNKILEVNEIKIQGYIDWEPYNGEKNI